MQPCSSAAPDAVSWAIDLSGGIQRVRSEEHTSELQSHSDLVCRLLLEKKKHPLNSSQTVISYAVFFLAKVEQQPEDAMSMAGAFEVVSRRTADGEPRGTVPRTVAASLH